MRRMHHRLVIPALVGLAVLLAAGCGGSSNPTTTTTSQTTTAAAATTATTTAAATTQATTTSASPTTTSAAATVPAGLGALASTANCGKIANIESAFAAAIAGSSGNIQQQSALLQQFAANTPSDIRPDFEIVAAAFAKIASALKGYSLGSGGVPNAATIAKLQALSSQLNQSQLTKAEQAIGAWAAKNCHA